MFHELSPDGIHVAISQEKIQAMTEFSRPQRTKVVKRLRMIAFSSKLVKNIAVIAKPLHKKIAVVKV